jgi:hypothetical protein
MQVKLDGMDDPVDELQLKHATTQHLYVGCPLFRLHGYYFTASNARVMWAVLNGMRPNTHLSKLVNGITGKLKSHTPARAFNFVHLRMETDWVLHCARWENIPDGRIRNNCMNNTDDIHRVLYALNVPTEEPLYVASFWEQVGSWRAACTASAGFSSRQRPVSCLWKMCGLSQHSDLGSSTDRGWREMSAPQEGHLPSGGCGGGWGSEKGVR